MRDWTQEQAAEHLKPYLGERWSKATYSAAERSMEGTRIRQFTADALYAFARGFDVPISYFLCPTTLDPQEIGHANSSETTPALDYLDMVFDVGEDASRWVLRDVVPMTAQTTLKLRRWGKNFAAMVAHREHQVEDLLGVREGEQPSEAQPANEAAPGLAHWDTVDAQTGARKQKSKGGFRTQKTAALSVDRHRQGQRRNVRRAVQAAARPAHA